MKYLVSIFFTPWLILFGILAGYSPRDTLRAVVNNTFSRNWAVLIFCTLITMVGLVRISDLIQIPPELQVQGRTGTIIFYGSLSFLGTIATFLFYIGSTLLILRIKMPIPPVRTPAFRDMLLALMGAFPFFAWLNFPGIGAFAIVFGWLFRYLSLRTRLDLSRENAFYILAVSLILEGAIPALLIWGFRIYTLLHL